METVVIIVFLFALARWTVSLVNLLLNPRLRTGNTNHHPLISILIPARNEESNLPVLMDSLLRQSYERYEVLIYDDESTDRTWEIIESYAEKDPRISGIKGSALPPGWLGKNHACHQLSLKAAGAYFLFLDADLCLHDDALTKAVFTIGHYHLDLLSVFPSQRMTSWGEKLTVPLMNWILLSMLPLVLVRKSKRNSLAAANGQFMMFPASSYRPNLCTRNSGRTRWRIS